MTVDSNAPLVLEAGLKPAQPLRQDTVAIRIPLCGPHKTIVILRSAATKNLRPLHTNRAVDEKTSANYRPWIPHSAGAAFGITFRGSKGFGPGRLNRYIAHTVLELPVEV